jgi:hypothetical protein
MGPKESLDDVEKRKLLILLGLELRPPDRQPAASLCTVVKESILLIRPRASYLYYNQYGKHLFIEMLCTFTAIVSLLILTKF